MLITRNPSICKYSGTELAHPINIGSVNIVPQWWYSKILDTGSKADIIVIPLLSELWFLYYPIGSKEYQKDYSNFDSKFNSSKTQIRRSFTYHKSFNLRQKSQKISNLRFVSELLARYGNALILKLNLSKVKVFRDKYSITLMLERIKAGTRYKMLKVRYFEQVCNVKLRINI